VIAISRRQFVQGVGVAGLGLLPGCGGLPGQSPPPDRLPRVGVLYQGAEENTAADPMSLGLQQGFRDFGLLDGQTIAVEARFAGSDGLGRVPALASELAQANVDVIVANGLVASHAVRNATATVPVVMVAVANPVREGLVPSLAHPDGNVTGVSIDTGPELQGKRLDLLKQVSPGLTRVALLIDATSPGFNENLRGARSAAQALNLEVLEVAVRSSDELDGAFRAVSSEQITAVMLIGGDFFYRHRTRVAELALEYRLPIMQTRSEIAQAGVLMAYGPSFYAIARRAAYYVDRILKGAKPADLPVEQPREFDFVINLKTAQALGLTIPEHVLLQATEVLQ
jgi:putative ABC transport system substrate-binding protein